MATTLGKAYIQIMPSAKGIKAEVEKILDKEIPPATEEPAENAGEQMGESMGSKLAGVLKKVILAAGFGKIVKESLMAGADLQQSIGGVETIFKQSANIVNDYARSAYTRAGVSANEYMEQVTSFSASLLQSLGGDTEKAAKYADRAMVDMSDNANKFGTNIGDIQNAYQGFAKSNYTMLDNLKLGYGGTQSEMQRLISDASKMKDVQEELGITVDESSMSFGNIVNAISVMQKSLNISGTTAREAKTTFSGSLASMKASATDFLASLTGVETESGNKVLSMSKSLSNLLSSTVTFVFGNLVPMAVNIISTLPPVMIEALTKLGPMLVKEAKNLANILPSNFADMAPKMAEEGLKSVLKMTESLRTSAGQLVDIGCDLLMKLAQGIANSLPVVIQYAPTIISNLANIINDNAPKLLQTGLNIIVTLGKGIIQAIPALIANLPKILQAIWDVFMAFQWVNLGKGIIDGLSSGITKFKGSFADGFKGMVDNAMNFLKNGSWKEVGGGITKKLMAGCKELLGKIPALIKSLGTTVLSFSKSINWQDVGRIAIQAIVKGIVLYSQLIIKGLMNLWDLICSIDWLGLLQTLLDLMIQGIMVGLNALTNGLIGILLGVWDLITAVDWLGLGASILQAIWNGFTSLVQAYWDFVGSIFSWIVNFVTSVDWLGLGVNILQSIWNGFVSIVQSYWNFVGNIFRTTVNFITSIDWKGAGMSIIRFIVNGLVALFTFVPNKVREIATSAKNKFTSINWGGIGSNIIHGIVNGVSGAARRLYDTIAGVAGNALKTAKKLLGIHSPSKVFENEVGLMLPKGAAVGVTKDKSLTRAIKKMALEAVDTAQVVLGDYGNEFILGGDVKPYDNKSSNVDNSMTVNQTINSAKELSPAEIADETEALLRRAKWA